MPETQSDKLNRLAFLCGYEDLCRQFGYQIGVGGGEAHIYPVSAQAIDEQIDALNDQIIKEE